MKILYCLKDDQYKEDYFDHTRECVRGVLINKDNKVALIHLYGKDLFGKRDYYELPGGGIKKSESRIKALKREMLEEVGVYIKDIKYLGTVSDDYNLIHQHNLSHYFLCYVDSVSTNNLEDYEKELFESIQFYSLEEACKLDTIKDNDDKLAILVKKRELPILQIIYKNKK